MTTCAERQPAPSAKTTRLARAFGLGCDARLAGLPLSACPFPCRGGAEMGYWWRRGWRDVHYYWSADALWPHLDLPPVGEAPP